MVINFKKGWQILQDVHDKGEVLGLYRDDFEITVGNQISEWEDLLELKHLQLIYAQQPYFGRELRYFNQAPWWYKQEFEVPADAGSYAPMLIIIAKSGSTANSWANMKAIPCPSDSAWMIKSYPDRRTFLWSRYGLPGMTKC